jgi:hypothetical protein
MTDTAYCLCTSAANQCTSSSIIVVWQSGLRVRGAGTLARGRALVEKVSMFARGKTLGVCNFCVIQCVMRRWRTHCEGAQEKGICTQRSLCHAALVFGMAKIFVMTSRVQYWCE